jgi:hypothetical protein
VESWRGPEQQRSGGVLIDVASDAVVAEGLAMPHSPRVKGEAIYLVESGRGALVRIDRQTGKREDVAFCPGFARGLAFAGRYAILTISLPRLTAVETIGLSEAMKARGAAPWRGGAYRRPDERRHRRMAAPRRRGFGIVRCGGDREHTLPARDRAGRGGDGRGGEGGGRLGVGQL